MTDQTNAMRDIARQEEAVPPEFAVTEELQRKIGTAAESIDLNDSALCLTYGMSGQRRLANVSDRLLHLVQEEDSAGVGERIADFVKELKDCSAVPVRSGFFGRLFRRRDRKNLRKRYETAAQNADRIAAELEEHRNCLLRDFVMLDKLYGGVLEQYRELTVLVEAGQKKLDSDTSAEKELRERFGKRLHDLKLSRMVCMQTLTQIRVLQDCNAALSEKIQSLLTNTVALWKNQTAMALAVKNTGTAMEELRTSNGELIDVMEDVCAAQADFVRESGAAGELVQSGESGTVPEEKEKAYE